MQIRKAKKEDFVKIAEIALDSVEPTSYAKKTQIRKHLSEIPFNLNNLYVAVVHNIVGFAEIHTGYWGERGRYMHRPMSGTIKELVIPLSYRRKGVGTILLEKCEEQLREMGSLIIYVDIYWENKNAQKFLEKRGYEVVRKWKWAGSSYQRLKKILN
ncbi:MAG: GNAT family N-acetyltransferase [Candidatus Ranarchaeia archaeon]